MTSGRNSEHDRFAYFSDPMMIGLVSLALAMPVSLGTVFKIELTPTFLLAPVIAYAIWITRFDVVTKVFVLAGICGIVSVTIVNLWAPGNVKGNVAELVIWTMFAPSFVFLGRLLPIKEVVFRLGVVSAVFLVAITVPLLITGHPTRAMSVVDIRGFGRGSYLDVHFFGLPVYASFGVNSLAALFCIQAALICAALFSSSNSLKALLAAGLACASLLILESDSRAAQGSLLLLVLAIAIFAVIDRRTLASVTLIELSILLGVVTASLRTSADIRLVSLVTDIVRAWVLGHEQSALGHPTMESVTTGRTILWKAAIRDVMHSPIFGNGFSGYGRFFPVVTGPNTTAHCYYLTILWKGGIVFAVPFAFFIALAFRRAWQHRVAGSEWYFAATALVLMFLLPSLTWDILMIPSAGALAWFVLGLLQGPFKIDSEIEYRHAAQTV